MTRADPRARHGRAARLGARLRRHQLDRCRAHVQLRASRPSHTSRQGSVASTSRCPRSETGSRSTAPPRCSSAPTSARRAQLETEGVEGRSEVVGDVMADSTATLRATRARPRSGSRRAVRRADDPPAGEHRGAAAARDRRCRRRDGGRVRLPGPPAHAARARRRGHRLAAERARDRAARLPRDARPHRPRTHGCHRLGRTAEGGVLAPRPLRDAPAEHRVGRHGRCGREPAGRARRAAGRGRGGLASRPQRRSSTATDTPPSASRRPCTLDRRAGVESVRRCRHRRGLRRRTARSHLRRGRATCPARRRPAYDRGRCAQPRREPHRGRDLRAARGARRATGASSRRPTTSW